jgi:hypothetical protein
MPGKYNSKKTRTRKNKSKDKHSITKTEAVYSEDDYLSNDGMLTTVWGPGMWHYLHTMSFNYPVHPTSKDKEHYRDFVLQLQYVLPCGKCRKNLLKNFKKLPLTLDCMESRTTFSTYIYDLHEQVNRMLGKKSNLTYDMVRERYEHFRARCAKLNMAKLNMAKLNKVKTLKRKHALEKGCTVPLYGEKSKCILKIVPQNTKCDTLQIDDRCVKKKLEVPIQEPE